MYYVKAYNKENSCIINAPFKEKHNAVNYYNRIIDSKRDTLTLCSYVDVHFIEFLQDDKVFFDCEV